MQLFTEDPGFVIIRTKGGTSTPVAFFPDSLKNEAAAAGKDEVEFLRALMQSFNLQECTIVPAQVNSKGGFVFCPTGTAEGRFLRADHPRSLLVSHLDGAPITRAVQGSLNDTFGPFTDLDQNLALLSEEALEVAGVVHKARRFGMLDRSPVDGKHALEKLIMEMGDFEAVKRILLRHGLMTEAQLEAAVDDKVKRLQKWYKFPKAPNRVAPYGDGLTGLSKAELARVILTEMFKCVSNVDGTYSNERESFHPASIMNDAEETIRLLDRWILTADWSMVREGGLPTACVRLAPTGEFEAEASHLNPALAVAIACLRAHRASVKVE